MGPFERLARRKQRWLFFFALSLACSGVGLILMLGGFITGLALPVYAGLSIAVPAAACSVLIVVSAHVPRKGVLPPETFRSRAR